MDFKDFQLQINRGFFKRIVKDFPMKKSWISKKDFKRLSDVNKYDFLGLSDVNISWIF